MGINSLDDSDRRLLLDALRAAVEGPFFEESDFHALIAYSRDDVRRLVEDWPQVADEELLDVAANNVLNMILTYPHDQWRAWRDFSKRSPRDLAALLVKWRGDASLDPSPHGSFDRFR